MFHENFKTNPSCVSAQAAAHSFELGDLAFVPDAPATQNQCFLSTRLTKLHGGTRLAKTERSFENQFSADFPWTLGFFEMVIGMDILLMACFLLMTPLIASPLWSRGSLRYFH